MKRLLSILIFLLFCSFSFSVTYTSTYHSSNVYAPVSGLNVPMTSYSHSGLACHSYKYHQSNFNTNSSNYNSSPITFRESQQHYSSYNAGSINAGFQNRTTKRFDAHIEENYVLAAKPGGGGTKTYTYTCPMCGGTGYINDNGNGELVTAYWWRQETSQEGDGTYCDGVAAYHDPCDADWSETGGTYHHDYKRVCPMCNGTGTVTSTSKKTPSVISGWVQWYGESWSHAYSDDDGDGHCDEHYWHVQTPIGDCLYLLVFAIPYMLLIFYKQYKISRVTT